MSSPPEIKTALQQIPSVDRLVENVLLKSWNERMVRSFRVRMAQEIIDVVRAEVIATGVCPLEAELVNRLANAYQGLVSTKLRKVINATGIILHTNLGRAPLGVAWWQEAREVLEGYSDLEFDVTTGERGSRTSRLETLMKAVTGADAAVVVNNNAAALFLILHSLARGKKAVVSRGELVQIGGGFRVPDIMESSGVGLSEVGTTNITLVSDYEKAVSPETAVLLKVHQSNFVVQGHTSEVSVKELSQIARAHKLPLVLDLGSGLVTEDKVEALSVTKALEQGASLICFSGDKLLGGGPRPGLLLVRRL